MGQQLLNLVKSCNDKIKKYAKQLVRNDDWLASGAAHSIQFTLFGHNKYMYHT